MIEVPVKRKILSIEAIRGLAAIYVMLGHIVLILKPYTFYPASKFWVKTIFGYGNEAVILFFIVSGFSIHYSSGSQNFSILAEVKEYIYKRTRRLYPLFFLSLILSLIVLWVTKTDSGWLRNLLSFFMITDISLGSISKPIATNFPIWSLSYEVIYYLIYPLAALSIKKYGIYRTFICSFAISIFFSLFTIVGFNNHLSNVLQMYWVWMAGAYMGDLMLKGKKISIPFFKGWLVLCVAFMFTLEKALFFTSWFWGIFFSLLMLSFFFPTNTKPRLTNRLAEVSIGLFGVLICYFITYRSTIVYHTTLVRIILLFLIVAIVILQFLQINLLKQFLRELSNPFVRAGGFSYAVYIIHWPLLILFSWIFKDIVKENIWILFSVIILYIGVVISFSWVAEKKIQPMISSILDHQFYSKREKLH